MYDPYLTILAACACMAAAATWLGVAILGTP
jgi:hypothetical protein